MAHVATTIQTYTDGKHIQSFNIEHYGHEALFIKGYAGDTYSLGTVRKLAERGGSDMDAVPS